MTERTWIARVIRATPTQTTRRPSRKEYWVQNGGTTSSAFSKLSSRVDLEVPLLSKSRSVQFGLKDLVSLACAQPFSAGVRHLLRRTDSRQVPQTFPFGTDSACLDLAGNFRSVHSATRSDLFFPAFCIHAKVENIPSHVTRFLVFAGPLGLTRPMSSQRVHPEAVLVQIAHGPLQGIWQIPQNASQSRSFSFSVTTHASIFWNCPEDTVRATPQGTMTSNTCLDKQTLSHVPAGRCSLSPLSFGGFFFLVFVCEWSVFFSCGFPWTLGCVQVRGVPLRGDVSHWCLGPGLRWFLSQDARELGGQECTQVTLQAAGIMFQLPRGGMSDIGGSFGKYPPSCTPYFYHSWCPEVLEGRGTCSLCQSWLLVFSPFHRRHLGRLQTCAACRCSRRGGVILLTLGFSFSVRIHCQSIVTDLTSIQLQASRRLPKR